MKLSQLRSGLLDRPPSQENWAQICAAVDACDDASELANFVALAQDKLQGWPADICLLPSHWANDAVRKPLAKAMLVFDIKDFLPHLGVAFSASFRIQSFAVETQTDQILIGGSDSRFLYVFLFEIKAGIARCLEKRKIKGQGAYAHRVERVQFLPRKGDVLAVMNAEGALRPFKASIKIWRGARCVRHIRDSVGVLAPNSWHSAMVLPDADTSRLFVWFGGEKRLLVFQMGTYRLLKPIALPPLFSMSVAGSGQLLVGLERASFGILDVDSEKLARLSHNYQNLNLHSCAAAFSMGCRQFCSIHPFDPDRYDVQDAFLDGFGGVYWWEADAKGTWDVVRKHLFTTDILPDETLAVFALHPLSGHLDAFVLNNFAGPDTAQLAMWRGKECHMFNFHRDRYHCLQVDPLVSSVSISDGRRILRVIDPSPSKQI